MAKKFKLPLQGGGFDVLCGFIGSAWNSLMILSQNVDNGFQQANEILLGKQDINGKVEFSIPATGWKTDTSVPGFTKYIDISVADLLATDIVEVDVAPASIKAARAANFTTTETMAGTLRLRAEKVPTEAIAAQYHILNTVDYVAEDETNESEGGN